MAVARESRLRRMAARHGLSLEKSRLRNRETPEFGRFRLVDVREGHVVFGAEPFAFCASIEDVEKWFEQRPEPAHGAIIASFVQLIKECDRVDQELTKLGLARTRAVSL